MANSTRIVCFVDIVNSTQLNDRFGNDEWANFRDGFLEVGKIVFEDISLDENKSNRYIKSIGDAHLIEFEAFEPALHFCTRMHQLYKKQTCLENQPIQLRAILYQGVVEDTVDDFFGHGVNMAARLEGYAAADEIWVNGSFAKSIEKVWGVEKTNRYFISKGDFSFRGSEETEEALSFDWQSYSTDYPDYGLAGYIYSFLDSLNYSPSNLSIQDMGKAGDIIWPVVPRDIVNAIHSGQIEIIRVLTHLGWRIRILIADCNSADFPQKEKSEVFSREILKYAEHRGLLNIEFIYLSDLYQPTQRRYAQIHYIFQEVISNFSLSDMLSINHKKYSESIIQEISNSATLDFLRPALTIAAVMYLAQQAKTKCIVIAGEDEKIQWVRSHDIPSSRNLIGAVFHPVLETEKGYQERQRPNWPQWYSVSDLRDDMRNPNLANWLMAMHLFPPLFPAKQVSILGLNFGLKQVLEEKIKLEQRHLNELARIVFDRTLALTLS